MGNVKETIESGKAVLGIEFGSTRIKAVLIDEKHTPIAGGSHEWENRYENGVWTYSLDDIWGGLTDCYASLKADVKEKYGVTLKRLGAIGFSAMMHGYMVFDKDGQLLVPFRTWRNSITEEAADELTSLFNYNIPQRWSIAHLYQAMLNILIISQLWKPMYTGSLPERGLSVSVKLPACSQLILLLRIIMQIW